MRAGVDRTWCGGGGGRLGGRTAVGQLVLRHAERVVAAQQVAGVEVLPAGRLARTRAPVPVDGDAARVLLARVLALLQRRERRLRSSSQRVDVHPLQPRRHALRRRRRRRGGTGCSRRRRRRRCRRRCR